MWKESLRIGIDLIDEQHKILFTKIGELLTEIRDEGADHTQKYMPLIKFLKNYTVQHFSEEETYQQSIGYEGFPEHKKLHEKFISMVLFYEKKAIASDFTDKDVKEFTAMLLSWLLYHVADADQKIGKAVKPAETPRGHNEIVCGSVYDVLHKMAGFDDRLMKQVNTHSETFDESLVVEVELTGDISGYLTYVYPYAFIKNLVYAIMNFIPEAIGDLEISTFFEVSNIISGTICRQIAKQKKIVCDIKPPFITQRLEVEPDEKISVDTGQGIMEVDLAITYP